MAEESAKEGGHPSAGEGPLSPADHGVQERNRAGIAEVPGLIPAPAEPNVKARRSARHQILRDKEPLVKQNVSTKTDIPPPIAVGMAAPPMDAHNSGGTPQATKTSHQVRRRAQSPPPKRTPGPSPKPFPGLRNLGSPCYLNAEASEEIPGAVRSAPLPRRTKKTYPPTRGWSCWPLYTFPGLVRGFV